MTIENQHDKEVPQGTELVEARERAVSAREGAVDAREVAATIDEHATDERERSTVMREEVLRLREALFRAREAAAQARTEEGQLHGHLREANQQLVLAAIRSQELAELAETTLGQLRLSEQELRGTAQLRELIIGIVSHDLRTPLAAIQMSVDILARKQLESDSMAVVERLSRSATRMEGMIKQLLDFTRAHAGGGIPQTPVATNLGDVCRPIIEELELSNSMPGRFICETRGDLSGTWDPQGIAQVISNLGANAVSHGAPHTPIHIVMHGEVDDVSLAITNQGKPIPAELIAFVFDPFRRAKLKSRSGGLGLGLFITQEIVRAHGGTISVSSNAAEGTTFIVRLPRHVTTLPKPK
jgi:signal transduction histidine kinase